MTAFEPMSSLLPKDTEITPPSVVVVDASAGSGKTRTLTRRLVQFLLSKRIPHNSLEHVLAITFTNNAAMEMKRRVLDLLKEAALGNEETLTELATLVSLEKPEIRMRAAEMLETILDRYGEFQVQTIDSFLARVFKSSALEFGFPPGFDIVIDSRPMLDEAFEEFAGGIKPGSPSAGLLLDLVELLVLTRKVDARFHWNPYRELARQVKNLYARIVSTAQPLLEQNRSEEFEANAARLCALVEQLGTMLDRSSVVPHSRFVTYRKEAQARRFARLLDLQFPNPPVLKSKSPKIELAKFLNASAPLCSEIEALRADLIGVHARMHFEPYIRTHRLLRETLDRIKRREAAVDLGDMTLRLATFVREGAVPELYLSLGETIHHFLIDEFQDTSPIQWETLKPLIENSLGAQGTLFVVGDMKQSIYGFRGADWRIMKRLMEGAYFPSAPPEILNLEMNYRSGENILEYTRKVFHEIVPLQVMSGAAQASGLASFRQRPRPDAKGKGLVETLVFEGDTETRPEREVILRIIGDCLSRGYRLRDCAILTPENEDVVKVSGWLNEAGYEFIPFSTLDIRTRKIIGELLALLRFLDSPIDDLSLATFLLGDLFAARLSNDGIELNTEDLRALAREKRHSGSRRPLYVLFREHRPELWERYLESLFTLTGYLPLYDLATEIYKRFNVFELMPGEEAALVKLLEVIQHFESRGQNSLAEFVEFSEEISEDSDWNMDVPPDINAVRVMTVHKAKGLDFRVVIVLLYDVPLRFDRVYMEETPEGVRLLRLVKKQAEDNPSLEKLLFDREFNGTVDQLNKLYVALTRAKDEMYILGVQYPQAKQPSAFLPREYFGPRKKPKMREQSEESENRVPLLHPAHLRREPATAERLNLEETQRGERIHAILARIHVVDGTVAEAVRKAIEEEEKEGGPWPGPEDLESLLARFLSEPSFAPFFEPREGRTILNEREFAASDGRLFRMDRVIVDTNEVTVVDFKTGEEQRDYGEQVRNYMTILSEIFPGRTIKGVLAYVDKNVCRSVE